jgi:hypothetical protein
LDDSTSGYQFIAGGFFCRLVGSLSELRREERTEP